MAEFVATIVAEEAVRGCFEMIGHYISYTRKYKIYIDKLKVELKKIEDSTVTISREIQKAKDNAEDIRQDVLGWLRECEELKIQVNELFENTRPFHVSCLCCSCPNLKSRYLASTKAAKLTSMITRHREEWKFDKVGQEPQLQQLPLLSPGEFYDFGSRAVIRKEVMDGLKNDSISVIGLCGMGGIGKTTLVKQIAEEAKNEKLFDQVAFVVVSQDQNVIAIQDQLASRLGVKAIANEMDINGRAELLYKRLMDKEHKILIILDDMWQELNLQSVGIPIHGDRKGFKILLTSRSSDVCNDMKVHKRLEVGILSKEDSWNLFQMIAEISNESTSQIAKEISQECAGLPLAIVTVGKSLRNKKEHAFRDVLRKLRDPCRSNNSSNHVVLYSCIKSSYDYLESDEHRLILLLCSIFPEHYEIQLEDLVRYARGLFDTVESMAEARDRVESIIDELMTCYLLLIGEQRKCVKLHDVVRDVCQSISSKSGDAHILLKFDDLHKRLIGLKSQRLRLLRLVNKESFWKSKFNLGELHLKEMKNEEMNFSKEMKELRVLEVNHITTSIPSYLQFMINLQTLSLDYCRLHGDFSGIRSLKMLRVLSFFHSIVDMFPTEITELTNLQCLDLRFKLKHPNTLPLGTLSSLKELEELYLGIVVSGDIETLEEVRSLSKLHTIQFLVVDDSFLEVLLKNLNISELKRFDIARIPRGGVIEYQIRENVLELRGQNVHVDLYLLKALMWRVELFCLYGEGLTNVGEMFGQDSGLQHLKELELRNCDIKYLVDATNNLAKGALSKLETLQISYASQLEELIKGVDPLGTHSRIHEMTQRNLFVCLKKLQIFGCDKIKSLFSKSMVNCLGNLEIIEIASCPVFERIVRIQKDEEVDCSEFPKLKHLSLYSLPGFRILRPRPGVTDGFNQVMLPKLERLDLILYDSLEERGEEAAQQELCFCLGSSLPKIRYLHILQCNNLVTIGKSGLVHGFQDLQTLSVWMCLSVEVVFDFEEIMGHISAAPEESTLLARLEKLNLFSLPKLKHIWRMLPPKGTSVFGNLKKMEVKGCTSLRYLLTPTITNMLVHLEEIKLDKNVLMEAMIGRDDIDMPNDGEQILLERLILPKLKSLVLKRLPSLRKLCCCSLELTLELPSLSKLELMNCPVDILTRGTHKLQNLTKIEVEKCGTFKYLFTSSAEVVHLEELVLCENISMEAIFGTESLDGEEILNKTIVLPNLKKIKITALPNFKMLCCSLDLNIVLPSLTQFRIDECPKMSKLCAGQLSAPQLINVIYGSTEFTLGTFINSWLKDCESMTRCLD